MSQHRPQNNQLHYFYYPQAPPAPYYDNSGSFLPLSIGLPHPNPNIHYVPRETPHSPPPPPPTVLDERFFESFNLGTDPWAPRPPPLQHTTTLADNAYPEADTTLPAVYITPEPLQLLTPQELLNDAYWQAPLHVATDLVEYMKWFFGGEGQGVGYGHGEAPSQQWE